MKAVAPDAKVLVIFPRRKNHLRLCQKLLHRPPGANAHSLRMSHANRFKNRIADQSVQYGIQRLLGDVANRHFGLDAARVDISTGFN